MATHIVLLRGVNLGPRNRVPMAELRKALEGAGFGEVRTYLQSGNVVLESSKKPEHVARECEAVIANAFGLEIAVVTRTRAELAAVVRRNPLGGVATNPKRYQVTFLASKLPVETLRKLEAAVSECEAFAVAGRELYAWHPEGVARSRLWTAIAGRGLGVTATSRNWTTVTALLELAGAKPARR